MVSGGLGVFRASFRPWEASGRSAGVARAPRRQRSAVGAENVTAPEILRYLQSLSNPDNVAGMARFGIQPCRFMEFRFHS